MKICGAVLVLASLATLVDAQQPVAAGLLPPRTRTVIGINLRRVIQSALLKGLTTDLGKNRSDLPKAAGWPGVDLLRDLDSVVVAVDGGGKDARGLAIVSGRFPAEVPKGAGFYHGVPILQDPRDPAWNLAVLDAGTGIIGKPEDVRAAIDRSGRPSGPLPKLAARLGAMAATYDIWGFGDVPEGLAAGNPAAKSLESIDHFEFGATLQEGLRVRGAIHIRTPEQASAMQSSLKMIEAMVKAKSSAGAVRFGLRLEDGSIKLELFVPEAELTNAMAAQKNQIAAMVQNGLRIGSPGMRVPAPGLRSQTPPPATAPSAAPLGTAATDAHGDTVTVTLPGAK